MTQEYMENVASNAGNAHMNALPDEADTLVQLTKGADRQATTMNTSRLYDFIIAPRGMPAALPPQ